MRGAGRRFGYGHPGHLAPRGCRISREAALSDPANMEGMARTKRCVFCDVAGKRTKEHVIPLWLGPLLHRAQPTTGDSSTGKRFTHRFNPGPDDASPPREWSTDDVDLVTNSVCELCNSGWLHNLETEARPLLTRLILGEEADLSSAGQKTVATWSYKTVLLFQLLRSENARPIPLERFRELFVLQRPPPEARVWLGTARGNNAGRETSTEVNMVNVQHEIPGFFSALALGRLLILCAGRLSPGPEQVQPGSRGRTRVVVPVWPASLRVVRWPPPEALENLEAKYLVKVV